MQFVVEVARRRGGLGRQRWVSQPMSCTPASGTYSEIARDPRDLYDILILRSPTRCATCHERIRDRHELAASESHDGMGTGNRPDAVLQRAGSGIIGHDAVDKDAYGAAKAHPTRTYCGECGRPSGRGDDETAGLDTMLDRIPALLACLERNDVGHDSDTIYRVVRSLKANDRHQARTDDIWRAAVALAVKHAE